MSRHADDNEDSKDTRSLTARTQVRRQGGDTLMTMRSGAKQTAVCDGSTKLVTTVLATMSLVRGRC